MALVHDNCLIPTIDEPGLGYVQESLSNQYVPDVFIKSLPSMNFMVTKLSPRRLIFLFAYLFVLHFQTADLYSNEAALFARPMPMEYLYFAYY